MLNLIKFTAGLMLLFAFAYAPGAYATYHGGSAQDTQPAAQTQTEQNNNNNSSQENMDLNSPGVPDTGAGDGAMENMLLTFTAILLAAAGVALGVRPTEK